MSQAAIDIVYTSNIAAVAGPFNGYRFDFAGDAFTRITDAVLGPQTTAPETNVVVTFDDDSVFINCAGLQTMPDMRISVLLTLE